MQNIGFLIYTNVQAMDILAPYELFEVWQSFLIEPTLNLYLISQDGKPVNCANSRIKIEADFSYEDTPHLDYLLVPGGKGRIQEMENPIMHQFLQKQANTCNIIASICTGAFLLHKSGLLKDHKATTYWRAIPELKQLHKEICEERVVKDGKIWSAGGVSSGLDIALELIREIGGEKAVLEARILFEYFPNQPQELLSNEADFSSLKPYFGQICKPEDLPKYIKSIIIN